jgi:hypothetical protein
VFAPLPGRADVRKTWVERVIGGIEHRVPAGTAGRSWFFLRHRWVSAVTWLVPGGTLYLFASVEGIPADRRQRVDSGFVLSRPRGSSPDAMHRYQLATEAAIQPIRRSADVHSGRIFRRTCRPTRASRMSSRRSLFEAAADSGVAGG